ncbi:MAG: spore coat associated protein CotJA [Acetanaerobacterium sp.]
MKNSIGGGEAQAAISCDAFTSQPISYAMAYVAFQTWEKPYEPEVGYVRGTIFQGLDKPFLGEEVIARGK